MKSRDTAMKSARALIEFLQKNKERSNIDKNQLKRYIEQDFEMIERELAGYLSHPGSTHRDMFNGLREYLFASGFVINRKRGICPGHDLIVTLEENSKRFPQLKNPEFGIRDILGYNIALELFRLRGICLGKMVEFNDSWQVNLIANDHALQNLVAKEEELQEKIAKEQALQKKIAKKQHRVKPLSLSDITLARLGILSFFHYTKPQDSRCASSSRDPSPISV